MEHGELFQLREHYNHQHILLCFNGPFSQGLIEEIGNALRRHMKSESAAASSAMDVFAVYIEIAQNIQHYTATRQYDDNTASATVVIGRDEAGHYVISAGNLVDAADGHALAQKIEALSQMDKNALKAAYKTQMRQPRTDNSEGAGLGLIDIARKASRPISCSLQPLETAVEAAPERLFFSLRVVI